MNKGHVAFFIDWENIKISMGKLTPPQSVSIAQLLHFTDDYGERIVARAYADWDHSAFIQDRE